MVNNKQSGCIKEILRIKNGFKNILNFKSFEDSQYCDIKFNVSIYNDHLDTCIIGEIQFLLKWQLYAKKLGYL